MQRWQILSYPDEPEHIPHINRLNALGSLYFFIKYVLQRHRLVEHLHLPICEHLESENLNYLLEFPRDHFKTTMVTEGLPMWWALPFSESDEASMRVLGYDDEWIRWMRWAHNPQIRVLIVSEAALNAEKLGMRIDQHFLSNSRFRDLFPEIIPNEQSTWNASSKHVRNTAFRAHGEGTFDFIGVGGALQSRHYDRVIEDDLVGKDAMKSDIIMADTIDYHRLLEGAFDGPDRTELVVGNRWSLFDLNGHVRKTEPWFRVESHGALGGCCDQHPAGMPIFPEEWTLERLNQVRQREGSFYFSHQYLNVALSPDELIFRGNWLRYYNTKAQPFFRKEELEGALRQVEYKRMLLTHEVRESEVIRDIPAQVLLRSMIVDPNHAGSEGRARHAILVTGLDPETDRIYLLDMWAQSMPYDDLMANVYRMADRWQMTEFWLETVAAQKFLKYHIEYRNKIEKRTLRVKELKTDRSKGGKWTRIDALSPLFEQGKIWVRHDQSDFLDEYGRYSHSTRYPVDLLDCMGYAPQTWTAMRVRDLAAIQEERRNKYQRARRSVTGY